MLSSQTKDPVTHQATMNLRHNLAGGLTVESLLVSTPEEINDCIKSVGFHNIKVSRVQSSLASPLTRSPDCEPGQVGYQAAG